MRNSNRIKLPDTVAELPVAPHRYLWGETNDRDDTPGAMPIREWKKLIEYQEGEVVYVVYGETFAKAYISLVGMDNDSYGDRRPMFRVHRETKRGTWSKLWYYTWPGFIQRGYLRAGLALDCEGNIRP